MTKRTGAWKSRFLHLQCSSCGKRFDPRPMNVCECGKPLLARYDLSDLDRKDLLKRKDLWRYGPMLPVVNEANIVSLGEGGTPLIRCKRLEKVLRVGRLHVKDDGVNPTGTFKARGMSVTVSKAKELGLPKLAVPTTGSAGSAMAAYAQKAGIEAFVVFAKGAPKVHVTMAKAFGAKVQMCKGYMDEAVALVQNQCENNGFFNIATIREPYRMEGKKTIPLEVAEELGDLPDVMIYPVGGGTGIVSGWKAWQELMTLDWCRSSPRLYFVQANGCAPVYKAWTEGTQGCESWRDVRTKASGLAIQKPFADELILRAIRETHGGGVVVDDREMIVAAKELESMEGISACREGAATWAGAKKLAQQGEIDSDETVILINTGRKLPEG